MLEAENDPVHCILCMSGTSLLNTGKVLCNKKEGIHMLNSDFRSPVSIDDAPPGSRCEWCGKPAMYNLLVTGGKHHNEEGRFCGACGEEFIRNVADSLNRI